MPSPRFLLAAALACAALPAWAAGDGCRQGFVWREAFAGDHVCVTPDVRAQARADNAQASGRVNPVNHDYGPDTCRGGYVWREASRADHVCVTPDVRTQAARDNAAAAGRVAGDPAPYGSRPVQEAGCCPSNMLVCPAGHHFCR